MSERPLPLVEPWSRGYWEAARRRELHITRCADCDFYVHPPRPTCSRCQGENVQPTAVSGRGTIYSFTVMHRPGNPGFDDRLPFAVVIVEIDEQPGLLAVGNVLDVNPADLEIGQRVEVAFEDVTPEITLPQWRICGGEREETAR